MWDTLSYLDYYTLRSFAKQEIPRNCTMQILEDSRREVARSALSERTRSTFIL